MHHCIKKSLATYYGMTPCFATTQIIITNMPKHSIYATLVRVAMAGVIFLSFPLVFINMKQVCARQHGHTPIWTAALCMAPASSHRLCRIAR